MGKNSEVAYQLGGGRLNTRLSLNNKLVDNVRELTLCVLGFSNTNLTELPGKALLFVGFFQYEPYRINCLVKLSHKATFSLCHDIEYLFCAVYFILCSVFVLFSTQRILFCAA